MFKFTLLAAFILTLNSQAETQDILLKKTLVLKSNQIEIVLEKTENNIKPFVENFDVKLDSGSKITSPKQISGTQLQPVLKISIKKCIFLFCQNIDLDAEFTLIKTQGTCDFNYQLKADIQRSSALLSDLYLAINTDICIQKTADGANAELQLSLEHAPQYDEGVVQKIALGFIKLQADGLLESFSRVMKINGVKEIK